MMASKAVRLLSLLPRNPLEVYDRFRTALDARLERFWIEGSVYQPRCWEELLEGLRKCLRRELNDLLVESSLIEIENEVKAAVEQIRSEAPFELWHNADFDLARLCYLICRLMKPSVVLETGVGYGVTSAFILKALELNRSGLLHSVDLPPLRHKAATFVAIFIPPLLNK